VFIRAGWQSVNITAFLPPFLLISASAKPIAIISTFTMLYLPGTGIPLVSSTNPELDIVIQATAISLLRLELSVNIHMSESSCRPSHILFISKNKSSV